MLKTKHSRKNISSPVEVVIQDVKSNPLCFHGPTLLFSQGKQQFFACSQYRDKKLCSINITKTSWSKENVKKLNKKYLEMIPRVNKDELWMNFGFMKLLEPSKRAFCLSCEKLFDNDMRGDHACHNVISPITDKQLEYPSTWLPPLDGNTAEAQYFFTKKSINVILDMLKRNKINHVLCIGTPSIHETLCTQPQFSSILLDCDKRHASFHPPNKFMHYNMFNNYFYNESGDLCYLRKFFNNVKGAVGIVMDPPFGGRVEPLINTLKCLTQEYKSCTANCHDNIMPVIWAFPYFSEPYICNMEPAFKMHDYQVEYGNHAKFQNSTKKGRKFGSPVRLFTNLPLETINLSGDPDYKYCDKCKIFVSVTNSHCEKCNKCSSKNGMTYKHCNICSRCVKPSYAHCTGCERCCPKIHACGLVLSVQSCYNCNEKGHKRSDCPSLKQTDDQKPKKKKRKIS